MQRPIGYVVRISHDVDEDAVARVVSALAAVEGVREVRPVLAGFESVPEMFRLAELRDRVVKAVSEQFQEQWHE